LDKSLSIIVTAIDETTSLENTIDILFEENSQNILEVILAISSKTTDFCRASIRKMQRKYPGLIIVHQQSKFPGVGGAIRESLMLVNGQFVVMMASDLETDPRLVKDMLNKISEGNLDVIATTRWLKGGSFEGYSITKLLLNKIFQFLFASLYCTKLSDMTYGYRMYRYSAISQIQWTQNNHAFFFESILRPLKLGLRIVEIPAKWVARTEGHSKLMMRDYLGYFKVGFGIFLNKI
jgi:glycosyltransferase involved in cell wall biosynthesis